VLIPFRSGFLLPPGYTRARGCTGAVDVTLKLRRTVLARKTVRLNARCRYSVLFTIRRQRLRSARVVTVVVTFRGNRVLAAVTRTYRVRLPPVAR
jgi:hypothetical protein